MGKSEYHIIQEECISCEACIDECPANAITMPFDVVSIDQDLCTECKACLGVCPTEAIYPF